MLPELVVINLPIDCATDFSVDQMERLGFDVELNWVDDIGPATKLIPTLEQHPNRIVVTVDDDVCYRANLFEELYNAHLSFPHRVVAAMAREVPPGPKPWQIPYILWPRIYQKGFSLHYRALPLGAEGILYPPGSISKGVHDIAGLLRKSATCDDVWFWSHSNASHLGAVLLPSRPASPRRVGSNESGLWRTNKWRLNNRAVKNLVDRSGSSALVAWKGSHCALSLLAFVGRVVVDLVFRSKSWRNYPKSRFEL